MKLLIISHTQHYKNSEGVIVGWGPTVTEINYLTNIFSEIYHIAPLSKKRMPGSAIPYISQRIKFIPIKEVGGASFKEKIKVLSQLPHVINTVSIFLKKVDVFQFRAPTGMGVYLIPYLTIFTQKKGWFKYAGNWKQENTPLGYAFQRWFLKRQNRKVTINGEWEKQMVHFISFENPCLTTQNRIDGKEFVNNKRLEGPINFCFVGSFNKQKGIHKIVDALQKIDLQNIGTFYFVGDGEESEFVQRELEKSLINVKFTGFLPKERINEIYKICHYIVLPSENEGFPKVIGEAMNYGCVPIVSDVSCIGQYIGHKKNGYLIEPNTAQQLVQLIYNSISIDKSEYAKMVNYNFKFANKFTYEHYVEQLQIKILNN